jgi:hypothetical protein
MWGRWIELAVLAFALLGYLTFSRWQMNQSGPARMKEARAFEQF